MCNFFLDFPCTDVLREGWFGVDLGLSECLDAKTTKGFDGEHDVPTRLTV